jgi:hypothetical protein
MPIPDFNASGILPEGEHHASWAEFCERFTWNEHRAELAKRLAEAGRTLRHAGCTRLWINGSFVTRAAYPNDVDVLYNAREVRPPLLDPAFRDKTTRKDVYGGDYVAIDMDHHVPSNPEGLMRFFQTDRDGQPKGIVVLSLSTIPATREE